MCVLKEVKMLSSFRAFLMNSFNMIGFCLITGLQIMSKLGSQVILIERWSKYVPVEAKM